MYGTTAKVPFKVQVFARKTPYLSGRVVCLEGHFLVPGRPHAMQMLLLKDQQRGDVALQTSLVPLATYLRNHTHWIPVGFRPLAVRPIDAETHRLQLPEFGALGFQVAPQMALRLIEDNECRYRLVSVPLPDLDYEVDFEGLFNLAPQPQTVNVFWETRFSIRLRPPGFLQMLPEAMVQAAAQAAVRAMTATVCHSLIQNICRDYRSRAPRG